MLQKLAGLASPAGQRARLSILIYHRVLPETDTFNQWDVTAGEFDLQMDLLARHFSPLPLTEAVERLAKGSLPGRPVCVTFDDGYADNAEVALPILARHKVPATFFVATTYLNGGRMWNDTVGESIRVLAAPTLDLTHWGLGTFALDSDEARRRAIATILPALKYLPFTEREARAAQLRELAGVDARSNLMMREDQVRTLHGAGMEIGAHTITHPILLNTAPDLARREIVESGKRLAEIVRQPVRLFAYPNGKPGVDYGPDHVRMVRDAGYLAAVSTGWGVATAQTDRFQLPRFTPWDRTPGRFMLRMVRNMGNAISAADGKAGAE
ncbi:MAG TPA: polysaccharide deacetylase family protein [Casimicrobiaceae bacterium]|nr:polysaccharide deacetylase family protein [Casimicrobiaceae bacterium]